MSNSIRDKTGKNLVVGDYVLSDDGKLFKLSPKGFILCCPETETDLRQQRFEFYPKTVTKIRFVNIPAVVGLVRVDLQTVKYQDDYPIGVLYYKNKMFDVLNDSVVSDYIKKYLRVDG